MHLTPLHTTRRPLNDHMKASIDRITAEIDALIAEQVRHEGIEAAQVSLGFLLSEFDKLQEKYARQIAESNKGEG